MSKPVAPQGRPQKQRCEACPAKNRHVKLTYVQKTDGYGSIRLLCVKCQTALQVIETREAIFGSKENAQRLNVLPRGRDGK